MADSQRWSVTYTKHVKQKRKVYQDGVLELQLSCRKVVLYDEGDMLLDSRFVKKDDVIQSGETFAFDSYLVDIGELCGGRKPASTLNCQEDSTVTNKPQSSRKYVCHSNATSIGRKPTLWKVKGRKVDLSPSETLIRDFRGREMCKYGSSPNFLATIKSSTTEWQVLYTTQVTQKSKKFHDGFLQLIVRGSLGRQAMLYDITRRTLESRFLKMHEIVCSGESLAFEGHLVEIGEQKGDQMTAVDPTLRGPDCKIIKKTDIANHQAKHSTSKTPDKIPQAKHTNFNNSTSEVENANLSWGSRANEPRRAVHDILTVLRKPIHIKEEPKESNMNLDCRLKVLKPKTVEILPEFEESTVFENGRECHARSSSFCLSMESVDQTKPVSISSAQPHSLADAVLDSEKPVEVLSCEEITTEKNAAATTGLSSIDFPQDHKKELSEFPSFDLGF